MRPACCRLGLVPEAFTGLLHCATGPGEAALPLRPLRDQLRSFHRGAPVPLPLHPIQTSPLLPFGPCRTVPALVPPGLYPLWSLSDCSGPCPHCFGSGALLAQSCLRPCQCFGSGAALAQSCPRTWCCVCCEMHNTHRHNLPSTVSCYMSLAPGPRLAQLVVHELIAGSGLPSRSRRDPDNERQILVYQVDT